MFHRAIIRVLVVSIGFGVVLALASCSPDGSPRVAPPGSPTARAVAHGAPTASVATVPVSVATPRATPSVDPTGHAGQPTPLPTQPVAERATPTGHSASGHAVTPEPTATDVRSAVGGSPSPSTTENGVYVFEVTLSYPTAALRNPWEDATVSATFTGPNGTTTRVSGFYYDRGTYKVRFAPSEPGTYRYVATVKGPTEVPAATGTFQAPASARKGFVRVSTSNPMRLVFDDGSFFSALGLNDCWGADQSQPDRLGARNFISAGEAVDADTYFATYAAAGFNLLRWDSGNCSFPVGVSLAAGGNTYSVDDGKLADQLLQTATRHGFRVMLGAFTDPAYPDAATRPGEQQALQQYFDYLIARYGAYVDIWELTNETGPGDLPDSWLRFAAAYFHAHDPYRHLVTNSNPRDGEWMYLDLRSPHSYVQSSATYADLDAAGDVSRFKNGGVPVLFGEAGNEVCNWDATSALRMRLRIWSTFFNEGELVFWNSSFKKNYCHNGSANLYIGPEERGYTRVFQDFTRGMDPRAAMVKIEPSGAGVRGYGLRSPTMFLAYLHHFAGDPPTVSTRFQADVPIKGTATWIDPATGQTLATAPVDPGPQWINSPPFAVDVALRIRQ